MLFFDVVIYSTLPYGFVSGRKLLNTALMILDHWASGEGSVRCLNALYTALLKKSAVEEE